MLELDTFSFIPAGAGLAVSTHTKSGLAYHVISSHVSHLSPVSFLYMPQFQAIHARIKVDNKELPEYHVHVDEDEKQVSCWIPSEAGKAR